MPVPVFVPDEVVTAARLNALPKGVLGYAQAITPQMSITGSDTALTGLTVGVTCEASRRIKITGVVQVAATTADNTAAVRIKDGAALVQQVQNTCPRVTVTETVIAQIIYTPTAGAHTFNLSMLQVTGTGTVGNNATSNNISFILVEDQGAV